jgi:hypothetical protein
MKLTGMLSKIMDNYLCLRGIAGIKALAQISEVNPDIQRDLLEEHKDDRTRCQCATRAFGQLILGPLGCWIIPRRGDRLGRPYPLHVRAITRDCFAALAMTGQ